MENAEEKKWCVYMHTFPNGKSYVGITCKKPYDRWRKNGSGYLRKNKSGEFIQPLIAKAILKYCKNDGDFENLVEHDILVDCLTKQQAGELEDHFIEAFQLRDPELGYNINKGGTHGFIGRTHTEEAKEKNRVAHLKENLSEETIEKLRIHGKNIMTDEHKEKLKQINTGRHHTEKERKKMSEASMGRTFSDETKHKISVSHLGEKNPMYGRRMSEESKEKLSSIFSERYIGEGNPMYGRCGALHHSSKMLCQFDKDWGFIRLFSSGSDVKRDMNINDKNVNSVCHEQRNFAGGYRWRLVYDCVDKSGKVILGALSLGLITEREIVTYEQSIVV